MCEQAGQAEDAASIGDDSHVQPFVTDDSDEDDFPISSKIARSGLYLPSGISLRKDEIDAVCRILKDILSANLK